MNGVNSRIEVELDYKLKDFFVNNKDYGFRNAFLYDLAETWERFLESIIPKEHYVIVSEYQNEEKSELSGGGG